MSTKNEKRFVYCDNAATTRVLPVIAAEIMPYFTENYGNPSSLYSKGRDAKKALDDSRARIAAVLNCLPNEIYFTGGGSEGDNWAIKGAAKANQKKGKHIISTKIEHPAVLNTLSSLEKEGFEVTLLDVYENGIVRAEDFKAAIRPDTVLAAIMTANNEIGTVQPIKELCAIAHENGVLFFTDAVQAVGHIDIDLKDTGVDMMSFSGHKIHAPKGIGVLYLKNGIRVSNLVDGGGQERKKRGGTENVPGAVGTACALELMCSDWGRTKRAEILSLREELCDELLKIPYIRLNGDRNRRLPGNINISCEFIEGESLILWLDINGICASTGSACSTASLDPSHVLLALGLSHETAHGSLRITLDVENTCEDIEYIASTVRGVVEKLRAMSPLYDNVLKSK
ncbi:MAG: aminotransferase class V-fold PLP-dependent enzyme [Oscillospiraceae bacterium]|nr:aminotransferase class V-fold PLP-dependent enzyme [Oscillospiraceae bacterium]